MGAFAAKSRRLRSGLRPFAYALRLARAREGLVAESGLGMLVLQAALAFERFVGRPAPVEVMRAALGL
ncbi:MAG: hypothetical protein IPG50_06755 [Myxococcales bacterium]|nr:hypothetical protein [Myxococcales bacterium]